jgi:ribose transport system substrate-binding protein
MCANFVPSRLGFLWQMLLVASLCTLAGCGRSEPHSGSRATGSADQTRRRIAVIPKSTSHVFWNSVEAGAKQAGDELGVEIIWKAPIKESDRAGQIQLVQQLAADNVDGIVLAPLDSRALVGPVRAATQSGVPVVIIDSGLDAQQGTDYVSFVATDNQLGGQLGGEKLVELLGGRGKCVLLRYMAGSDSTTNREAGFLSAIEDQAGIELISENRFAGTTSGEAQIAALNMIDVLRQADGIFCPNESSTDGMLQALRKEGLAGKVTFVGFDASPPLVEALEKGEIRALVVQNPYKMGYLGVKTLVAHLDGQTVDPLIDTGVAVVTRDNMQDPEIKSLLP